MKQYRLQPGTSSRIYYLLTVNDNGTMPRWGFWQED